MNNYEFEADISTEGIFDAEMTAGGATTPVSDYEVLNNKPMINGNVLVGNKTSEELGIITETDVANLVEAEATARKNADKALSDRIDNLALTGSAQGESITITDAANNCGLYSLHIEGKSVQNGTPTPDNPIEIESIGDSGNLDITAMTGNQLASLPDVDGVTNNGITWTCKDGVVTAKGTSTSISATTTFLAYYMPTGTVGTFYISGGNNKITVYMYVKRANGTSNYVYNNSFVLDGTEQTVRLYLQIEAGVTVDDTIYPMLNKGTTALPFESYKGNTATITSALPLCSAGDVKDELIFNADGTAKIIKRTYLVDNLTLGSALANCNVYSATSPYELVNSGKCTHSNVCIYSGEDKEHFFTYSTAIRVYLPKEYNITASDIKVVTALQNPIEISLTADETAALFSLEAYEGLTNIFNSDSAVMSVKYWRNEDVGSLITSTIRNTNSRLAALENTLIGG